MSLSKITPSLWFPGNAEEAINFYTSVFKDSNIKNVQHYTESGQEFHGQATGSVLLIEFELNGNPFIAMNGPPICKFTQAVSFSIDCKDQAEVDYFFTRLGEGGDEEQKRCGK
jgi:predicted 3-demethylubiquinone-9 3-methyltransferase (glyoxalase superfamily)